MLGRTPTLKEINESHRRFWENQHLLLTQRMTDVAVRETAFEAMRVEQVRGLSVYYKSSIYQALEDAEHTGFVERLISARVIASRGLPYRKSNPDVLMVQSSQQRLGDDAANCPNRPRNRRILA
jgi:hypothetical protein